jgi:hypothetical protein
VAFSPDGRRIVSSSDDNKLLLWDSASGKRIGSPFLGHTGWVRAVAFSPDGRRIVSASQDKTLRLWDAATGKSIGAPLQGHTGSVNSLAFSPDGEHVVSGSVDKTLRMWNVAPRAWLSLACERLRHHRLLLEPEALGATRDMQHVAGQARRVCGGLNHQNVSRGRGPVALPLASVLDFFHRVSQAITSGA